MFNVKIVLPKLQTVKIPIKGGILNTELNDLRKLILIRKSEVFVERISVFKVIENLAEHVYTVCHAPILTQISS